MSLSVHLEDGQTVCPFSSHGFLGEKRRRCTCRRLIRFGHVRKTCSTVSSPLPHPRRALSFSLLLMSRNPVCVFPRFLRLCLVLEYDFDARAWSRSEELDPKSFRDPDFVDTLLELFLGCAEVGMSQISRGQCQC
jgi:hypothetical protein